MDKNDRTLEERPNKATGSAKRWVKKPSPAEQERARQAGDALRSVDDSEGVGAKRTRNVDITRGLGPPPVEGRDERFLYRRNALINAIGESETITDEEREILGERFGIDGPMITLMDVAERRGTTQDDIRRREIIAIRKVEAEFTELVDVYNFEWARGDRYS